MSDRLLLLHGLDNATNVMTTVAAEAGYRLCASTALADVLTQLRRGGMSGICVESAGSGSLERIVAVLREVPETLRAYLIVLDEGADDITANRYLLAGADDVIRDAPGTGRFELHLRAATRFLRLQHAFCRHALHDPLTGVFNRGAVTTILERELQRAHRFAYSIAVVMSDFDRLKQINDLHGHLAGDAALRAAVNRIQSQLRPYDAVGRYGGDEFIIVLSNCAEPHAHDICQRIHRAVVATPVSTTRGAINISLSMGVWITDPRNPGSATEAIGKADGALYEAKRSGTSPFAVRH